MKIFISWSGDRSKQIAVALKTFTKMVLQETEPWISSNDIDGGSVWFNKITQQLKESQTSIICLTHENINEPWILFEAGAVAKGIETNRPCTLLIDLNPTDIKGPLAQFNHTLCNKDGLRKLLNELNKSLKQPLEETQFDSLFEALWPSLSPSIEKVLAQKPSSAKPKNERRPEDMLAEILERIRTIENQTAARPSQALTGRRLQEVLNVMRNDVMGANEYLVDEDSASPVDSVPVRSSIVVPTRRAPSRPATAD